MGDAAERPAKRTLRLALAMRGGVSLAVWIGGAVAEIDVLRRASDHFSKARARDDETPWSSLEIYSEMLRAAGYDTVEVDILAGASAGGLNAVIYGFAQSVGRTTEWAEGVWCKVGSIWELLRPTLRDPKGPQLGRLRVPSLMQGDEYFYVELRKELVNQLGAGRPDGARRESARHADHVSIDLSATLADRPRRPVELRDARRRGPVGRPARPSERSAVHFRFTRRPADRPSCFTDLPGPGSTATAAVTQQVEKLAYAGRATSSFPGAFEPATVWTAVDEEGNPERVPTQPEQVPPPHMVGVFSETGPEPYAVVDGGIFDNVPIGRALDAVAAAAATGPTERRMLFLDPSPGPRPEPARRVTPETPDPSERRKEERKRRTVAAWIPTIVRALGLKVREENSGEEIDLVRQHNLAVAQASARLEVLAVELAGCSDIGQRLDLARRKYVEYRVARDVGHLAVLLTRPSATLLRASTAPVCGALAMDERDALRLGARLRDVYLASAASLSQDVVALVETAAMVVAWCREVEDLCWRRGISVPPGLGKEKRTVYRVLDVGRHLRDIGDTTLVEAVEGNIEQFAAGVGTAREAQSSWTATELEKLHELGDDNAFWASMTTVFDPDPDPDPDPGTTAGDGTLIDSLWQQLDDRRAAILECCQEIVAAHGAEDTCWGGSIFAQLHREPLAGLDLPDLHVVLAAAGGGPGINSEIRYHEITGDEPTPLAHLLGDVLDAERRRRVTELLRNDELDAAHEFGRAPFVGYRPLVDAGSKLAGNSLANFSAFLARDWRAHDWRWGRLDAATGLVDVVLNSAGVKLDRLYCRLVLSRPDGVGEQEWETALDIPVGRLSRLRAEDADTRLPIDTPRLVRRALCTRLQYQVLTEGHGGISLRDAAAVVDRPKAGLGQLSRRYLFGLASRMLHLSYRGVWPSTRSFPTFVARAAMVAVRPLLVYVPLLAAPPRALLALAGLGWLAPLARNGNVVAGTVGPWPVGLGAGALLVSGGVTALRAVRAWQRWSAVAKASDNASDAGWDEVATWYRTARLRIVAVMVAAGAVLLWAALLLSGVLSASWSPSVLLLAVVALAGLAAAEWVRAAPAPRTVANGIRLARVASYVGAVAAVAVVGLAGWHLPALATVTGWGLPTAWQAAAVAAIVGALLYDGWVDWRPDGLLAVGAGAAAAFAASTVVPRVTPAWAAVVGVTGVAVFAAGLLRTRTMGNERELAPSAG